MSTLCHKVFNNLYHTKMLLKAFIESIHGHVCLNSLAESGVANPMRAPYAHTYVFVLFPTIS